MSSGANPSCPQSPAGVLLLSCVSYRELSCCLHKTNEHSLPLSESILLHVLWHPRISSFLSAPKEPPALQLQWDCFSLPTAREKCKTIPGPPYSSMVWLCSQACSSTFSNSPSPHPNLPTSNHAIPCIRTLLRVFNKHHRARPCPEAPHD